MAENGGLVGQKTADKPVTNRWASSNRSIGLIGLGYSIRRSEKLF
jgi:hypothetical protein